MENYKKSIALPAPKQISNKNLITVTLKNNSLVLIGANGSGKTRLGVWLDTKNPTLTHRIGAQRSLMFEKAIKQSSYEESTNMLLYGNASNPNKKIFRWGNDQEPYHLLSDYNTVLSALIDKENLIKSDFFSDCKQKEETGEKHTNVPKTIIDELYEIWKIVFPHRNIEIRDAQIHALYADNKYDAIQMSDGEKVALYLICQCLVVPNDKILIIDEPEIHLHRSIMNRLWSEIEGHRPNCTFIYITHDTQFAASHVQATKVWVKNYDGTSWDWEEIESSNLPEECLLEILGNRKNVLFVEGTADSPDTQLYRLIYPDFFIVPSGSCTKVIEYTKAMEENGQLHHLKAFGLVDRDFRSEKEITALEKKGIKVLDVAEIENVFCIEPVLQAINKQMNFTNFEHIDAAKTFTITQFKEQQKVQVLNAITAEMHFLLSTYPLDNKSLDLLDTAITDLPNQLHYEDTKVNIINIFQDALTDEDYMKILKLFNQKGLVKQFGSYFGLQNNSYIGLALRLIKDEDNQELRQELRDFLPTFEINVETNSL